MLQGPARAYRTLQILRAVQAVSGRFCAPCSGPGFGEPAARASQPEPGITHATLRRRVVVKRLDTAHDSTNGSAKRQEAWR
jgi:hypothetical protein